MIKRLLATAILTFVLMACIEAGVQLWHRYKYHSWYTPAALADRFATPAISSPLSYLDDGINLQVVHPYLGFVHDVVPVGKGEAILDGTATAKKFGYPWNKNSLPVTTASGQVNILITGGLLRQLSALAGISMRPMSAMFASLG